MCAKSVEVYQLGFQVVNLESTGFSATLNLSPLSKGSNHLLSECISQTRKHPEKPPDPSLCMTLNTICAVVGLV